MTFTGQLGTINSVLGLSLEIGVSGAPAPTVKTLSATNAISLSQTQTVTKKPRPASASTLALSESASYVGPKHVVAVSTIVLAQSNYIPQTLFVTPTQAIAFAQDAEKHGTLNVAASSLITLNQILDTTVKDRVAEDTLTLTQSAAGSVVKVATSQITLADSAVIGQVFVSANSPITFTQLVRPGPRVVAASSALAMSQSPRSSIRPIAATSPIALVENTTIWVPKHLAAASQMTVVTTQTTTTPVTTSSTSPPSTSTPPSTAPTTTLFPSVITTTTGLSNLATFTGTKTQAIQQYLSPTQTVTMQHFKSGAKNLAATSTIAFTSSGIKNKTGDGLSNLAVSHQATATVSVPLTTAISLTSQASIVNFHAPESVNSALSLTSSATFLIELGNTRFLYSPFVGDTTDPNAPTPPPATLALPLANQKPFQLVYPASGLVTDSLAIRAPNLGNKDRLAFNRINRETRGGTLIVFADPIWPKSQTMVLSFSALHKSEAQALLSFMLNHLGQQVGIVDWEFYYWTGVITNADDGVVQDSRDSYTASFEFEGVRSAWTQQTITNPNLGCSSTSQVALQNRMAMNTCDCVANTGSGSTASNSAQTDATVTNGTPVYITALGHVALAVANSAGPSQVAGLTIGSYTPGFAASYITEGEVTQSDWTGIIGSASLSPGRMYFLDPVNPGMLTTIPPTTVGQYLVPVGRALSTTTFAIELEATILL